jgi:hypothetical protein
LSIRVWSDGGVGFGWWFNNGGRHWGFSIFGSGSLGEGVLAYHGCTWDTWRWMRVVTVNTKLWICLSNTDTLAEAFGVYAVCWF